MSDAYTNYNNQWLNVKNNFKNKQKLELNDIIFGEGEFHVNNIIYDDKIININNEKSQKIYYFEKSRQYIIDIMNKDKYDLVIELGSGYGRNIFYYLKQYDTLFNNIEIISGEYTPEGCETQRHIKDLYFTNSNINIHRFDYNSSEEFFNKIKTKYNNILILTFWSIEQITYINDNFFNNLLNISCNKLKCINIEPIGWQISENSIMKENINGYRSYYNKNLYSKLKELENKNIIKINNIIINYFNYDEPQSCGSLIEWEKQ